MYNITGVQCKHCVLPAQKFNNLKNLNDFLTFEKVVETLCRFSIDLFVYHCLLSIDFFLPLSKSFEIFEHHQDPSQIPNGTFWWKRKWRNGSRTLDQYDISMLTWYYKLKCQTCSCWNSENSECIFVSNESEVSSIHCCSIH